MVEAAYVVDEPAGCSRRIRNACFRDNGLISRFGQLGHVSFGPWQTVTMSAFYRSAPESCQSLSGPLLPLG
ncbi:hypothetical protein MPC4_110124 [Methylocella tundrae]|uniref:Uncharacterized protein n=1 Tax=Methylocella tundrae TaxID=227605 RepID=A0A4U8Z7T1_METTU|nr:protein of unknown function [Methylocella tundrae]VTZ48824.1 hypothetical protein MPC4_110124 [Methylocella tundrae]